MEDLRTILCNFDMQEIIVGWVAILRQIIGSHSGKIGAKMKRHTRQMKLDIK